MKPFVVIPWSGGIDSTGLLFKAYDEGFTFHAHFIEMKQERSVKHFFESRHVEMLRGKIYKDFFHFDFSRSVFDLSLCPTGTRFWSEEVELCIIARLAVHFSKNFSLVEVWDGYVKEDGTNNSMIDRFSVRGTSSELFNKLTWESDNIEFKTPFKHISKKQIWNEILPKPVRSLTFSCESPYERGPCGKCKDCRMRRRLQNADH